MIMKINGIEVKTDLPDMTEDEARAYIEYVSARVEAPLKAVEVKLCADGKVDVSYEAVIPFERIRRVTGYLTGTLKSWNNAKQAEERERVKHGIDNHDGKGLCNLREEISRS